MVFPKDQFWGHCYLIQTSVTFFITTTRCDIVNCADNTPYVSRRNIEEIVASLEELSEVIFQWFEDNQFQGNANKCHVLFSHE